MKISLISYYSGINARGVETFVHHISNQLVKNNIKVIVYQCGPAISDAEYEVRKLNSLQDFPNIDKDTDVIFPFNGRIQSFKASIWAKTNNKKIIISGQSGLGLDDRLNLYTFPDVFISLTKYQSLWAKKINPFIKMATIPNGVDLHKFKYSKRKELNSAMQSRILSVGALTKHKRHDLTINAVSKIPDAFLTIIGEGEEESNLYKMGNLLLKDRFKIIRSQHSEIYKYYENSDVFVFPTVNYESFGIVLLEAMASNLPVVTNDDPIRREIVGDAGLFVKPEDVNSFTENIYKAINTDWGLKPRKQSEKYSWDIIVREYINLLASL